METPQNPPSQSSAPSQPGGVVMAQPPPAPDVPVETVVIPTQPPGNEPEQPTNPFVSAAQETVSAPKEGAAKAKTSGGGARKWIVKAGILIILLALLVVGGRFVWGLAAASREVTITYWGLWESDATVRSVIADFEASHPKIKVQYLKQSHPQYRERLQAALTRGEGPDVFRFHNTWVPMLVRSLAPVPEQVMTVSEFSSAFYPVATRDLVAGNTIYGIPLMIDGLGLYYNEDLFATVGVTPPTTWNDVLELVPKLTVKNDTGIVTAAIALGTAGNVEHFSDILATMILQNGAELTNLGTQQAQETMIFYRKFSDPSDPVYTWDETLDNSVAAFASGRVAMILAPSWRAFDIRHLNPALRFKIVPIPQLPGNTVTWASYWVEGVSAQSQYSAQAWELVKFLTSREGATKLYTEASKTRLFGEPYARVELGNSLAGDPLVGAYITQAPTAKSFPLASRTFDNGLNDKLIKYLEDAVNAMAAGTAPSAALETATNGFRQVLSTYGLTTASQP